jgi:cytochrome c peroxidase
MADVEEQAGGPVLNPVEMAIPNEKFLIDRLSKVEMYKKMFAEAFPDQKKPITYENIRFAIAAFERTLTTPSKFDDYLGGNVEALSDVEKKGLSDFISTGCTACHSGSLLGGTMFQKFGLFGSYWDLTKSANIDEGKATLTKNEADKFVFLAPALRNVEKTAPYFHDGSVSSLAEATKIMAKLQLNKDLTDAEVADMVAFMNTLTGELPADVIAKPVELADQK